MATIETSSLKLDHRYTYPEISTAHVEVTDNLGSYVTFYEKEFIWHGEYNAIWEDYEDPETKVIGTKELYHCWHYTFSRSLIGTVEYVWVNDSQLWMVRITVTGTDIIITIAFRTKENAIKMYRYFCQYKGFENY